MCLVIARFLRDEQAARRIDSGEREQPADLLELAAVIFANIDRAGSIATEGPQCLPPRDVEEERRVAAQAADVGDVSVGPIDLRGPDARSDQPARLTVPAVQNVEQGAQQNQVADPAEPDDDGF